MKIWEVELATDSELGEKLVEAKNYQEAIDKVIKAALANNDKFTKLTPEEKKLLHVVKVELYCEMDVE